MRGLTKLRKGRGEKKQRVMKIILLQNVVIMIILQAMNVIDMSLSILCSGPHREMHFSFFQKSSSATLDGTGFCRMHDFSNIFCMRNFFFFFFVGKGKNEPSKS